jgi:N-acetylneuraminate lyase
MKNHQKFTGLVAAPFTPMDKKGNINYSVIPEYYNFLEKNGVAGAFINGSTGECASLTQKEKLANASKWSECLKNGGKVRIINLVGGTSYEECIENAIHSRECGFSAIGILAPYYFKPDEARLAEFVIRIAETVPEMPVYFYHIPVLTGVYLPMFSFLKRISLLLSNFAGIKFTHEDLMDFSLCITYKNRKYDILWGKDECMLSAFAAGCRGVIGSTYNYAAPLYHELIMKFDAGDMNAAAELQQVSVKIVQLLGRYGGMAAGKAFMKHVGIDCGEFRLPVANLTPEMHRDFIREVKESGLDSYLSKK